MHLFNKCYEKVKAFMKENYIYFLIYFALLIVILWPMPYYIYIGGGTIPIDDRVTVEGQTSSEGSFHLAYVSELRATLPTYLLSFVIPGWDLFPMETVQLTEDETPEDVMERDKIYLTDANQNAIQVAYTKASKTFRITGAHNRIVYLMEEADTSLKIGDIILSCDGEEIDEIETLRALVQTKEVGTKVDVRIKRDGKEMDGYFVVQEVDGQKLAGISFMKSIDYETDPALTLSFSDNESGPSGGLLLAISIYDKLIPEDLTQGRTIVGTGTIDASGNVGAIGGVKYKLQGAVQSHADIFLVPAGENYEECIALQEQNHYDIKIIGVSTFDEAIEKLRN